MTRSASAPDFAKTNTASSCGNRRRALLLNSQVMQKSRDIFPVKTAHHLSEITGYSLRACEYWLSGKSVIPTDALVALLHDERGKDFLAVAMSNATPRWWLWIRAGLKRASFAAFKRQHEREMRELLDDSFPAPSAASMFYDEDFYGGQPSPPRQSHRSLARKLR